MSNFNNPVEIFNGYEVYRINNCVNGNPRYVVSYGAIAKNYNDAIDTIKNIGGSKYRAKSFGGGVVFSTYGDIKKALKKAVELENEKRVLVGGYELKESYKFCNNSYYHYTKNGVETDKKAALDADIDYVKNLVEYTFNGSFGYHERYLVDQLKNNKRANYAAQIVNITFYSNFGVDQRIVSKWWHNLTPEQQKELDNFVKNCMIELRTEELEYQELLFEITED